MKPRTQMSQMSLLRWYSPPIASPSEGRAGALYQLGTTGFICHGDQHTENIRLRPTHFCNRSGNNSPPFKSKSACGCAAQLVYTYVFQKGGKKTLKVLKIRKKYVHKLVATSLGAKTLLRWNTDFTEGGEVLNCFEACPLFWWLNWNLEVWL